MIKYIKLKNFKSIKNTEFALSGLNFFFGNNSVGKSSIIQSLLLLRQSFDFDKSLNKIKLNGQLVNFGSFKDILCEDADEDNIYIDVLGDNGSIISGVYSVDNKDKSIGFLNYEDLLQSKKLTVEKLENLNLFNDKFVYLNAQHISPSFDYDIKNWNNNFINYLGNYGQFVFPYISQNSNIDINKLLINDGNDTSLISALNYWLGTISKGIQIKCEVNNDIGKVKVSYTYKYADGVNSSMRNSLNVGYGITHVISLLYSLLVSNSNTLIVIENPESHLHPRAQSSIGKLMALAAKNGAQIICETHSDHVINSIRLVVKEGIVSPELCNVLYFSQDENYNTKNEVLDIDKNGNFDTYPEGFLDEWDNAIINLV